MNNRQKHEALAYVRGCIRGWAFAPKDWIPGMIQRAEKEAKKLSPELQGDANILIEPLRQIVKNDRKPNA